MSEHNALYGFTARALLAFSNSDLGESSWFSEEWRRKRVQIAKSSEGTLGVCPECVRPAMRTQRLNSLRLVPPSGTLYKERDFFGNRNPRLPSSSKGDLRLGFARFLSLASETGCLPRSSREINSSLQFPEIDE